MRKAGLLPAFVICAIGRERVRSREEILNRPLLLLDCLLVLGDSLFEFLNDRQALVELLAERVLEDRGGFFSFGLYT